MGGVGIPTVWPCSAEFANQVALNQKISQRWTHGAHMILSNLFCGTWPDMNSSGPSRIRISACTTLDTQDATAHVMRHTLKAEIDLTLAHSIRYKRSYFTLHS